MMPAPSFTLSVPYHSILEKKWYGTHPKGRYYYYPLVVVPVPYRIFYIHRWYGTHDQQQQPTNHQRNATNERTNDR